MEDITTSSIIRRINGSAQRGGWRCEFVGLNDTDIVATNQRVIAKWRGGFGAPPGIERTAFKGYVLPTRYTFDRTSSQVDLAAETSDGFIRRGWLQGIPFAEVPARSNYHQFDTDTMNMGLMIQHILGYYDTGVDLGPNWVAHCNMVRHLTQNPLGWITLDDLETTTFDAAAAPDGTMALTGYNVRETDNAWSRLQEIARNEFFEIFFDKNDNLFYVKNPMYQAVLPTAVMDFDEDFSVVPPTVELMGPDRPRQVRLHAVTDEGGVIHSEYPASPTHVYGRVPEMKRLRCNDQDTLDDWAERYYLYNTRTYNSVRWQAPGLAGLLFEIWDRISITYSGTSYNGVDVNWSEKKFWIMEIDVVPSETFGGISTFVLHDENV